MGFTIPKIKTIMRPGRLMLGVFLAASVCTFAIDGIFSGRVIVLVHDTGHLNDLIKNLKAVDGVLTVDRIESEFS
jgi:hypothetical protein